MEFRVLGPEVLGTGHLVDAEGAARAAEAARSLAGRGAAIALVNRPVTTAGMPPEIRLAESVSDLVAAEATELAVPNRAVVLARFDTSYGPPVRALPGEVWDAGQDVVWAALPDQVRDLAVWAPLQTCVERAVHDVARRLARSAAVAAATAWADSWTRTGSRAEADRRARAAALAATSPRGSAGRRRASPQVCPTMLAKTTMLLS